jgi:hypothetical protein
MAGGREEMEGTMSGLSPRWKEKRMQEEIYKQSFKYVKDSSNGLSPHGSNGTTIALDHQTPSAVGIGNQNWRGDHAVALVRSAGSPGATS